jgi:endonuclease/exonuclease/phosphatase family metal-dependent hydrolase
MDLRLITANISADFLSPPGVPPWDERKSLYVQALDEAKPDIIGLQEVTPRQFAFLRHSLPEYHVLTVSPADPDPALLPVWQARYGKFGLDTLPDPYETVLFCHTNRFSVVASGHWWLSPTPDRPSIGFGNIAPRAIQWARLQHQPSGQTFTVFNTHIDRRCVRPMVELCRDKFQGFIIDGLPAIFMGDFNFNPHDPEYQILIDDGWQDSFSAAAAGDSATFLYDLPHIPGGRIDHILFRGGGLKSKSWTRIDSPDPMQRISDHDPVIAWLSVQ